MRLVAFVLGVIVAFPAWAERRALVVFNTAGDPAVASISERTLFRTLERNGFVTSGGRDLRADRMRALLSDQVAASPRSEETVILLIGPIARSTRSVWVLGNEVAATRTPPALDVASVGGLGLDLGAVLDIAALAPDGAVILVGEVQGRITPGAGLAAGFAVPGALPRGVKVIYGPAAQIIDFAQSDLLAEEASLLRQVQRRPTLRAFGVQPGDVFLRAPAPPPAPEPAGPTPAEERAWDAARAADTVAAYESFLRIYPAGFRAGEARAAIDRLSVDPATAEQAMALSRDARVAIQRSLTDLGFNTRGIDGLFGPGTRAALEAWQRSVGLPVTGYLTPRTLDMLTAQAGRATADRDRADGEYWRATGAAGDEAGLRAYLGRYPRGLFADVARSRLAVFESERAAAADRAAWDRARRTDTVVAYREYLRVFPAGLFQREASARIDALSTTADRDAWDRARSRDTVAAYRAYLDEFPRGRFVGAARDRISALGGDGRDERRVWEEARRINSIAAYADYIDLFPRGRFVAEARDRIAALEGDVGDRNAWARAERMNTSGAYRAYLEAYPRGAFAGEAERRIAAIEGAGNRDEVLWQEALRINTPAAYLAYLAEYPEGRHKAEAVIRLITMGIRP